MWKRGPWWAPLLVTLLVGAGACSSNGVTDVADGPGPSVDVTVTPDVSSTPDTTGPSTPDIQAPEDVPDIQAPEIIEPPPQAWSKEVLGDPGELSSLFVVDMNEAYAVGGPYVVRYNGAAWASFGKPGDGLIHGVWAGDGEVVVVGEAGFIARRMVHELTWTVEESGTFQHLRAVHGRGPNDLWAAGNDGIILHYEGAETGWVIVDQTSNIDLYGIYVDPELEGADGVVTCGTGGRLVLNDAGVWKTSHVASGDIILKGIFGIEGRMFAVGTEGTIAVRSGDTGSWVGQPTNLAKDRDLYAVSGAGRDDIYAFGEAGTVLRWLGTSWQQISVGAPLHATDDYVGAGWAKGVDGADGHWIVVGAQGGGITSIDGSTWSDMTTQPLAGLTEMATDVEGRLWVTGRDGVLMVRDEGLWSSVATGTTRDLHGLEFTEDGELWLVGEAGTVVVRGTDGTLDSVAVPAFSDLLSVHSEPGLTLIGGKGGTLLRRAGEDTAFTPWTIGMTTDVRAIERGGDGALWIAGGFGKLYRSEDGETATLVQSTVSGGLNAMVPTEEGVLIVGDNGVILRVTESDVALVYEQSELFLYGVSISGEYTVAVGWNGTALRLVDGEVVAEDTGANQVLEAVWHDGVQAIAVGRVGHAYVRMEAP